ncbi:hypothetical protein AXG93_2121s1020 [Marchantia polymorpha subsp. ruderalis]|uniref:RNA helicase n=1 Tax=Marchantia polymorpha subsp. ruderalis TaxID=1480154 RepID=A0A176WBH0_MARPO|nr:hypothetical protein AXG93_2121s1020 [Marchantia polymorpha subsp. ruderalis]
MSKADPIKKVKKLKSADKVVAPSPSPSASDSEKKKKKKEKKEQLNGTSPPSPMVVENGVHANGASEDKSLKRKKNKVLSDEEKGSKKLKVGGNSEDGAAEGAVDPLAVTNFRISKSLRDKLKSKGIEALFPIQAQTFDDVFDGKDLVGRARTGQGKTLAFVLPILESLTNNAEFKANKRAYGRSPSVIVLTPTRELAKQVHSDFEFYGQSVGLTTVCVYGGAPYPPQENALRRGVDVVVGTPGRIKDHFNRGSLNLKTLKFRVLDEADEMLNMGFVDDVETILGGVEDATTVQTLLFSATMPEWVKQIASRFLKPGKTTVDLVGDEKMKASAAVKHLLMPCVYFARAQVVADIISCYGSGGRCIVFTETKNDASELAGALSHGVARALHGDISQAVREQTLAAFRSAKFTVLVATDVAARGLDINDVQLVVQCEPPRDAETYIHRSGRTGRAGKLGISVMLYDRKKEYMIAQIERKAGFKFERIAAPQPADIAKASATSSIDSIREVSDSVLPLFRVAAQELLDSSGLTAVDVIAKALAKISGHTDVKRRSLFTSTDDATTLYLQAGSTIYSPTYAFNCLRKFLSEESIAEVRRMQLTADGKGAVFDVPPKLVDEIVSVATAAEVGMAEEEEDMEVEEVEVEVDNGDSGSSVCGSYVIRFYSFTFQGSGGKRFCTCQEV